MKSSSRRLIALTVALMLPLVPHVHANPSPSPTHVADVKGKGVFKIVSGLLLVPIGLAVMVSNNVDKCERDGGIFGSSGVGPCSEKGSSTGGQVVGGGIMVAGILLIGGGAGDLSSHK